MKDGDYMRALVIVDIHKSESALEKVKKLIDKQKPDLLIIAGDITTFGPLAFAERFLAGLPEIKTLALPGNCDHREILTVIDHSQAINLHGRNEKIDDILFVGLGGSNATPFNTPFELTEKEIYERLDKIMAPGAILVLHFPVKGHLDEVPRGEHAGSEAALRIVQKYQPSLVISGHIHETRGVKVDDNGVKFVNPGALKDGFAAIIEITPDMGLNTKDQVMKFNCEVRLLAED